MAKATVIRKAIPATEGTREHKVEGEPYRAAKPGYIGDPGEVRVTMTVDEAYMVASLLGRGVCSSGNTNPPSNVWSAIESVLFNNPYSVKPGSVYPKADFDQRAGWPYLHDNRKPTA